MTQKKKDDLFFDIVMFVIMPLVTFGFVRAYKAAGKEVDDK